MFKFELGTRVAITASEEVGEVIGRAEYQLGEDAYLLRYKAADGRAVDAWWSESALQAAIPVVNVDINDRPLQGV